MLRTIFVCFTLVIFLIILPSISHAGFLGGQNFALPMEEGVNFNSINYYFSIVTTHALADALLKAGFFITLLLIIIRFGYGETRDAIFDLGAYFFITFLLVAPVFGGKSLLVKLIDTSDYLTQRIVQAMGGLEPRFAGGRAGAISAITLAKNEAFESNKEDLAKFKKYCYNPAANKYAQEHNGERLKPSDGRLDYSDPLPAMAYVFGDVRTKNCAQYKDEIQQNIYEDYQETLSDYKGELIDNGIDISKVDDIFNKAGQIQATMLFDNAVETAKVKKEKESLFGFLNFFRTMDLRSLIMIGPRLVIAAMGETFLWIFDFYIYNLVVMVQDRNKSYLQLQRKRPMIRPKMFWMLKGFV